MKFLLKLDDVMWWIHDRILQLILCWDDVKFWKENRKEFKKIKDFIES